MKKELRSDFSPRQFMVKNNFELYYYSDRDQLTVEPHQHEYHEIYFFLEGDVSFQIGNQRYPLQYGDFVLIPPGMRHNAIINNGEVPYRRFIFWVSRPFMNRHLKRCSAFTFMKEYLEGEHPQYIFHNDQITFNEILQYLISLLEEVHSNQYGREDFLILRAYALLMHLGRCVKSQLDPAHPQAEQELYVRLLGYIEAHLDEELTLDSLAAQFFMSKYHIAHTFKAHMGVSIHQFITKKRLLAARNDILTGQQANHVCIKHGFHDYPGFFRAFKKEFGLSPKTYRKLAETSTPDL